MGLLFHASSNQNISIFTPRAGSVRDKNEGPVVFATPDKAYASCFLVKLDDSWARIGRWKTSDQDDDPAPWVVIISDKKRFMALDKGGAIYSLPGDTFNYDKNKGTGFSEWTSRISVRPIKEKTEVYSSGLEAMLDHGVQVFFIIPEEFQEKVDKDPEHGYELVKKLQKEGKSENIKTGKGVRIIK